MPTLNSAAPVLASLDIARTVSFYCSRLGFTPVYVEPAAWGIVSRDSVQLHFWHYLCRARQRLTWRSTERPVHVFFLAMAGGPPINSIVRSHAH